MRRRQPNFPFPWAIPVKHLLRLHQRRRDQRLDHAPQQPVRGGGKPGLRDRQQMPGTEQHRGDLLIRLQQRQEGLPCDPVDLYEGRGGGGMPHRQGCIRREGTSEAARERLDRRL